MRFSFNIALQFRRATVQIEESGWRDLARAEFGPCQPKGPVVGDVVASNRAYGSFIARPTRPGAKR
jgi:hypothetical protein